VSGFVDLRIFCNTLDFWVHIPTIHLRLNLSSNEKKVNLNNYNPKVLNGMADTNSKRKAEPVAKGGRKVGGKIL
jgi:hypothetical protein